MCFKWLNETIIPFLLRITKWSQPDDPTYPNSTLMGWVRLVFRAIMVWVGFEISQLKEVGLD